MKSPDPSAVEAELAAYYDDEGDERLRRPLEPDRLAAREMMLSVLAESGARTVLEVGSGPGRDAPSFINAGYEYVAVDLSVEHLRRCQSLGPKVVRASARHLPFRTSSFDGLWTMSTLMHIPDNAIGAALAEVTRVVRPGGVAMIGVWGGPDIEEHSADDVRKGRRSRLFSRRSDIRWRAMLAVIGRMEFFEASGEDDFHYQVALVRVPRSRGGHGSAR